MLRCSFEQRDCTLRERVMPTRHRDAESPNTPTPTVVKGRRAGPATVGRSTIPTGALTVVGRLNEIQRDLRQIACVRRQARFSSGNDQDSRNVINAVAVFATRESVLAMFERSKVIGDTNQVLKVRCGSITHDDMAARGVNSVSPSAA